MTLYEKLVQVKREHPELAETMNEAMQAVQYPFRNFCMQEARYCLEKQMCYPKPEEETVRAVAEELMNSDTFASDQESKVITQEYIRGNFIEIRLFVPETYTDLIFFSEKNRADEARKRLCKLYADIKNKDSSDTWKCRFLNEVAASGIPAVYEGEEHTLLEKEKYFSGRIDDVVYFLISPVTEHEPTESRLTKNSLEKFVDFDFENIEGGSSTIHARFHRSETEDNVVLFVCFRDGERKTLKCIQEGMMKWKLNKMIEEVIAEKVGDPDAIIEAYKCQV